MAYHAYLCNNMRLLDNSIAYPYGAAQSLEKDGKCVLDSRTGMAMVAEQGGYALNMQLYFNYMESLRKVIVLEKNENVLALAQMGFIPALCEPSFAQGAYAEYLMPILEKSGLPLYRRKPMSFCARPSDMSGVDIWVHKQDCVDILHAGSRAEHVTAKSLFTKLGVTNLVDDVRNLCGSNGGTVF